MSVLSSIREFFGGPETANHVVKRAADGLYYGIDKAFHTSEEKAEEATGRVDRFYQFVEKTFDENSIRNVTRRWLIWAITGFVMVVAAVCIVLAILAAHQVPVEPNQAPVVDYNATIRLILDIVKALWIGEAFTAGWIAYFGVQFTRSRNP